MCVCVWGGVGWGGVGGGGGGGGYGGERVYETTVFTMISTVIPD